MFSPQVNVALGCNSQSPKGMMHMLSFDQSNE
jgi:hypothetical protein